MEPHAAKRQQTLFDMGCTKRKREEGDGPPRELRIRLDPGLAQRVHEHDWQVAAAIAARPAPPPPRPVGRPRKVVPLPAPGPKLIWLQLLPTKLPGQQEGVRVHLHDSPQAAAAAAQAAEWDKQQRVWLRLDVQGRGGSRVEVSLRASPFPVRKKWSEWEKEFAVETARKMGSGRRSAAARWLATHCSKRFAKAKESHIRVWEKRAQRWRCPLRKP
eukprot:1144913-Pelagomonas_calceolata.AAC.2